MYLLSTCCAALGGPKLLERNNKATAIKADSESSDDSDSNDGDADDPELKNSNSNVHVDVPSFRSDRRIVRWMIARCFANMLQQAFLKQLES